MEDKKPSLPTPDDTNPNTPDAKEIKEVKEGKATEGKQAVIEELERLSTACLDAFNDHDFEYAKNADRRDFLSRVSPNFQARIENYPEKAMTWSELSELWSGFARAEPDCRFRILNMSTDIHGNGTAVVWVEVDATGVQDVHWIRLLEMKWRIRRGTWTYYSCTTISGNPGNSGLV